MEDRDGGGAGSGRAHPPSGDVRTQRVLPVTWVMAYPDTLAATDTRAILSSLEPGKGKPLLPKGRLTRAEEDFLEGLRAFMDNDPQRTAEAWSRLRGRSLSPALTASMRVNLAVL